MSALDDSEDDEDVYYDDFVSFISPILSTYFVFIQDLTDSQISVMKECFPTIEPSNDKSKSTKVFCLSEQLNKEWDFLKTKIPWDIAKILAYVKCSWSDEKSIIFFKSDIFIRRAKLQFLRRWKDELDKKRSTPPSQTVRLQDILSPKFFCLEPSVLNNMDILTVGRIASIFFFNPKILAQFRDNLIVKNCRCKNTDAFEAFKTTKEIIIIDESQKIEIGQKVLNNINKEEWFDNKDGSYVKYWNIPVKPGNGEKVYHLYLVIKKEHVHTGYYKMLTFVDRKSYDFQ